MNLELRPTPNASNGNTLSRSAFCYHCSDAVIHVRFRPIHKHTTKHNSADERWQIRPWRLAINPRMLKTLVMDVLVFKPQFSPRLSRIFFSASSRLSRNFRGRLAGLAQIPAGGRPTRGAFGLWVLIEKKNNQHLPI